MSSELSDKEVENSEIEECTVEMHNLYSDWLRPTDINIDREDLKRRWASTVDLRDDTLYKNNIKRWELVRAALGTSLIDDSSEHWFRQAFKARDEIFKMTPGSNDNEISNLAAATLACCLEDDGDSDAARCSLATCILTASFFSARRFFGGANLIQQSDAVLSEFGGRIRARISPASPSMNLSLRKPTLELVDNIEHGDLDSYKKAMNGILKELQFLLGSADRNVKEYVEHVDSQTSIQDEELEILWWLFGGKSQILNRPFTEINQFQLIVIAGIEISRKTKIETELPSIKGLLIKLGVDSAEEVSFKSIIESTKEIADSILTEDRYCPLLTPTLFALSITRESSSWQKAWERATGLKVNILSKASDWGVQIYRESLIAEKWSS